MIVGRYYPNTLLFPSCSPPGLPAYPYQLNSEGFYCSLNTGQERRDVPFATHLSCTIEMASMSDPYEVAVIDEIQMVDDPGRGQHWTAVSLTFLVYYFSCVSFSFCPRKAAVLLGVSCCESLVSSILVLSWRCEASVLSALLWFCCYCKRVVVACVVLRHVHGTLKYRARHVTGQISQIEPDPKRRILN